jgi:hypothetical protein
VANQGANPPLRPRPLLEALVRGDVRFIILGGIAERMLGSPRITEDFDICPAGTRANLERLANVLNEIGARWAPPGLEDVGFDPVEPWNARSFGSHTSLALITRYGRFDVWLRPTGTGGYDELIANAISVEVHGLKVSVISLTDSIRIKRAIGAPRYLEQIQLLRDLQQRRRERGDE